MQHSFVTPVVSNGCTGWGTCCVRKCSGNIHNFRCHFSCSVQTVKSPASVVDLMLSWCVRLQVHYILQEVVMGGMVLETNMNEIVAQVEVQNRMEKSEVSRSPTLEERASVLAHRAQLV